MISDFDSRSCCVFKSDFFEGILYKFARYLSLLMNTEVSKFLIVDHGGEYNNNKRSKKRTCHLYVRKHSLRAIKFLTFEKI